MLLYVRSSLRDGAKRLGVHRFVIGIMVMRRQMSRRVMNLSFRRVAKGSRRLRHVWIDANIARHPWEYYVRRKAAKALAAQPNLVSNPGFETSLTGWNTSGSASGVQLTQANVSHSGTDVNKIYIAIK